jgi:hypothetical protein
MNYRDMERNIFAAGCYIEYEFTTGRNELIRGVTTVDGKQYKMKYKRNEHYVFIICDVQEV